MAIVIGPGVVFELIGFLSIVLLFGSLAVRSLLDPSQAFVATGAMFVLRLIGLVVNPRLFSAIFRVVIPLASLTYLVLGADIGQALGVLGPLMLLGIIAFGFFVMIGGLRR